MAKSKLVRIPEVKPIVLGCYTLTATGLSVKGRPSFDEHQGVGDFIQRAHKASGFWLADWLRIGDERQDWKDKIDQAIDSTGLSEKRLKNVRAVGAIEQSRRREGVEFGLHEEVAGMEPAEQTHYLEMAESQGWDRRELRQNVRADKRTRVIEGQAVLEGMYRVIYADPPWKYGDSAATEDGSLGKAERAYEGMEIEDICNLPVKAHALPDAVLFLWVTSPFLQESFKVIEAWGFEYKTSMVWDKILGNYGHYVHVQHEFLLICTRGSCLPDAPTPSPKSVLTERRSNVHSEKPESIRKMIEKLYIVGPFLELFARKKSESWDCFGNDARLWAEEAER